MHACMWAKQGKQGSDSTKTRTRFWQTRDGTAAEHGRARSSLPDATSRESANMRRRERAQTKNSVLSVQTRPETKPYTRQSLLSLSSARVRSEIYPRSRAPSGGIYWVRCPQGSCVEGLCTLGLGKPLDFVEDFSSWELHQPEQTNRPKWP